jgi:hypothetical protein
MEWNTPDLARSIFSLVAKNNGFFKSAKQRDFLKKQMASFYCIHEFDSAEFVKGNYGVTIEEGQYMWVCEGEVRWAEYGNKSYRRVAFAFVLDQYGVVSKNKLHFKYYDNGNGSGVNAEKTEVGIWVRDTSVDLPVFVEFQPEEVVSQHVGSVGEFLETTVTVKSIRAVGQGYYGTTYQTRMVDADGNIIIYWGIMKDSSVLDREFKIRLRAKVKEHGEYKGINQTIVGYAKIKEVLE